MSRRLHVPAQEIALPDLRLGHLKKTSSMAALKAMQASLLEHGLRAPLVVVPATKGGYEVVDGYVRTLAARKIGWKNILCVILPIGRSRTANEVLASLVTRVALGDLADHELARRAIYLRDRYKVPASKLAEIIGRSPGSTCNLLRWWESVPPKVSQAWAENHPLITHAELERYSKMSPKQASEEWGRAIASSDHGASWSPGGKTASVRQRPAPRPRNGEYGKTAALAQAIEAAPIKPPVKSFVRKILGFLMGKSKEVPGVTNKGLVPKEIRS